MQLDQQIPMEKAFTSPSVLAERMGTDHLDAAIIAALPPETLLEYFRTPPALHRFPGPWRSAPSTVPGHRRRVGRRRRQHLDGGESGVDLVKRIGSLPGFGDQKAKIFAALLAKQFGVTPPGWQEATGDYGQTGHRSIADVVDDESRVKVREYKKAKKAALKG